MLIIVVFYKIIETIKSKTFFFFNILLYIFLIEFNWNNNSKNSFFSKSLYEYFPKTELNITYNISIEDIFNSKKLYINDSRITPEYIDLFKGYNSQNESLNKQEEQEEVNNTYINLNILHKKNIIKWDEFYHLCKFGKLIEPINNKYFENPLISVILPSFNKEKEIVASIRSIQNQSFKNIEIIIVDDCSTDQSIKLYNQLQKNDSRIRIFYHLKNFGVWRSRLDGFLYSRGKYIIFFDTGDFYADNFVLEDSYNLMTKYNLDSLRFAFKMIRFKKNNKNFSRDFNFTKINSIILGYKNYNVNGYMYGTIWNRMIRKNIIFKSLKLVDSYILNAYKNLWEDRWWNTFANMNSYRNLFINRIGYLYIKTIKGEGILKLKNNIEKEKALQEFIYFLLFDFFMLPKKNNKKTIIKRIREFNNKDNKLYNQNINIAYLKNFKIYNHLLKLLINDSYIYKSDKMFIHKLLNKKE